MAKKTDKQEACDAKVVRASDDLRMKLVAAYSNRRAVAAEHGQAQMKIELVIAQIDTTGALRNAFAEGRACGQKLTEANLKLGAVLDEIQKSVGQELAGFAINPDDGTLTAPLPVDKK